MMLDQKMETTHKKKTSKLRGLFFIKLPSTLAIIF